MPAVLTNDPNILRDPAAKRQYNRQLFAEVAPRYFAATRLLSLFRDRSWKRHLLSRLKGARPGVVVDIACGTGDLAAMAARQWPKATIVGCDLSLDMMAYSGKSLTETKVRLTCQDMASLGLASQSADVLTGGYALRNAPNVSSALAEFFRVLKPDGSAAFLEFSRSPTKPLFFFQYWVLRLWGGLWGLLLHGNPAVYAYIAESLRLFPNRELLRDMFTKTGFCTITFTSRMAGLVDIVVARKPPASGSSMASK
jgi:demethylmenaquinone methyltransferase/2-methoxy-6-polyprenyl-1,4-benzoquinol methylase